MNYFSFLYQCNMIRVFPLCAGVIDLKQKMVWISTSVSPVCGGYRAEYFFLRPALVCFPCVGVIGGGRTCREWWPCVSPACGGYRFLFGFAIISTLCFPCVRGYRRWRTVAISTGECFPCVWVIGDGCPAKLQRYRVSPVRGLSALRPSRLS